jgi:outer membrane immunogenic protein
MRRSLITAVVASSLFVGLGATAFAKTHHHPPPPPPPPAWNWSGFYTGVNLGYGWGSSPANVTFLGSTGVLLYTAGTTVHPDGVIGGGQMGYNWQNGNWVAGLEADIQGSGQSGSGTIVCPAGTCNVVNPVTVSVTEKLEWFGTVRGRLGWTVTPETMVYATGGLAYGKLTDSGNITDTVTTTSFNFSKTSLGWTAGGGVEGHLTGNWTWKVEYLFLSLDEPSGTVVTTIAAPRGGGTNNPVLDPIFTDNIVRAGLNYKWQ